MKGLVLSGGGAKGAYEAGAIKALSDLGYKFDLVLGTSIGAINSALYVQGGADFLLWFWTHVDVKKIIGLDAIGIDEETLKQETIKSGLIDKKINKDLNRALIRMKLRMKLTGEIIKNAGLSSKKLEGIIKKTIDEDKIRKSKIDFGLVTVNVTDMKSETLFKNDIPKGMMAEYILASASCFPTLKATKIKNNFFVDGAYFDNMPINMALDKGCDEIISIYLKAPGIYQAPKIKRREDDKNNVKIKYLKPSIDLGDMIISGKDDIRIGIKAGYIDVMKMENKCFGSKFLITNKTLNIIKPKLRFGLKRILKDIDSESKINDKSKDNVSIKSIKKNINDNLKNDVNFYNDIKDMFDNDEILERCIKESLDEIYDIISLQVDREYFLRIFKLPEFYHVLTKYFTKSKIRKILEVGNGIKFEEHTKNIDKIIMDIDSGSLASINDIKEIFNTKTVNALVRYIMTLIRNELYGNLKGEKSEKNSRKVKMIYKFLNKEFKTALFILLLLDIKERNVQV